MFGGSVSRDRNRHFRPIWSVVLMMDDLRVAAVTNQQSMSDQLETLLRKLLAGMAVPLVSGAAPLADVAEVVATDATSSADAGILFPADPAGVVTIGVAPLADAGWSPWRWLTWPMLGYCSRPTLLGWSP